MYKLLLKCSDGFNDIDISAKQMLKLISASTAAWHLAKQIDLNQQPNAMFR